MRISNKLMLNTVVLTISTVCVSAVLIGRSTYKNAKIDLQEQAVSKLITLRDNKADRIRQYFDTVTNQVVSFSNNMSTVSSMKKFRDGYNNYLIELKKNRKELKYKKDVIKYYTKEFEDKYASKNGGVRRNAANMLNFSDETTFALQYQYTINNPYKLTDKSQMLNANDGTSYSEVHKKFHRHMYEFLVKFGYYDILMVDAKNGKIVYSVDKNLDFTTSLVDGPFANTHIGDVYRQALKSSTRHQVAISDYKPYLPSYDNQTAFVASAIWDGPNKIGVMIFQLPIEKIDAIMTSNRNWIDSGLGDTGESYLIGADKKMRSNSRFLIENKAAYINEMESLGISDEIINKMNSNNTSIGYQVINTAASNAVVTGQVGYLEYVDYRGVDVIGAYEPLEINGLDWGIITEIDQSEAFSFINKLLVKVIINTLLISIIVMIFGVIGGQGLARQISIPIETMTKIILHLAKTQDLTKRLEIKTNDELEEMSNSLNVLISSFQQTLQETIISSRQVQMQADKLRSLSTEDGDLKDTGDNIAELTSRLQRLSRQFKVFEEEAERKSTW